MTNDMPNQRLRALIVEDSEDDAQLLVADLEAAGYELHWHRVETEEGLREALEQGHWDIVFSDFSMPRFRGDKALEIIRQRDPDLPFIFVSGTIGEDAAVAAMKAGAQDYVMKGNTARLIPAVKRELQEAWYKRERRRTELALRRLSKAVEQAAESVFITSPEGLIEYVNPAFERLTGFPVDEVYGKPPSFLKSGRHDDSFYRRVWEEISAGEVFQGTFINRRKDGALFYEEKVITPLRDDAGRIDCYVSTGRDITDRVRYEEARARLIAILEATTDIVAIADAEGHLLYLNQAGRALFRLGRNEDISSSRLADGHTELGAQRLLSEGLPTAHREGVWHGEVELKGPDGADIPVSEVVLAHPGDNNTVAFYSVIARDISERKRFEEELLRQATHDALTGLPNRFFLIDRLDNELRRAERLSKLVGVIFLDLDNFKRINDSLGHAAGDALLKEVAQRLRDCLRPTDTVARYGGDEFTVIIGDINRIEDLLIVERKLQGVFQLPVQLDTHEIYVTISMGTAVFPNDGGNAATLLKNADTAMYRAKSKGRNQNQFYSRDMNAHGHELLNLESDLRRALERNEYILHYQPQLDLRTARIVGLEALLRWQRPQAGELVPPTRFIPMLEDTGLIVPVGEWVLRQACAQWRSCISGSGIPLRFSVNVSARQFVDQDFVDMVARTLKEEGIQPGMLELEITESTVMQDVKLAGEILAALDALGVRLALDDFGTGYSSLAYLKRYPLDALKIDRTFVMDLPADANDAAITEASISLGHKLGLEVVAEGVETREQFEFLKGRGCNLIQGYLLARPMEAEALRSFVEMAHTLDL